MSMPGTRHMCKCMCASVYEGVYMHEVCMCVCVSCACVYVLDVCGMHVYVCIMCV